LLTQKCAHKKRLLILDTPTHVRRIRKHQIENRFPELALPTFFKM
jgi:hypothetical protein